MRPEACKAFQQLAHPLVARGDTAVARQRLTKYQALLDDLAALRARTADVSVVVFTHHNECAACPRDPTASLPPMPPRCI